MCQAQFSHYKPLIRRVIDQPERRIFQGEKVPSTEKIVSIFDEYTDSSGRPLLLERTHHATDHFCSFRDGFLRRFGLGL
jgi:hypothetical protein